VIIAEQGASKSSTHHKLPTLHEFFVDHLTSIVFACFDMNGFLYDSVCPASQRFPGSVLEDGFSIRVSHDQKTKSLDTGQ
jgi:hypothetical protein